MNEHTMITEDEAWAAVMGDRSPAKVAHEFALEGAISLAAWVDESISQAVSEGGSKELWEHWKFMCDELLRELAK